MQINAQEIEATKLELELYLESDEADYDLYLEGVTQVCQLTLLDIVFVWFTSKKYSLRMLATDSQNLIVNEIKNLTPSPLLSELRYGQSWVSLSIDLM